MPTNKVYAPSHGQAPSRLASRYISGQVGDMITRPATNNDADGVAAILQALADAGKRRKRCDPEFALNHYISHPDQIRCSLAIEGDEVLGFNP